MEKEYLPARLIVATIKGKIKGLNAYLMDAPMEATETIKLAETELNCLEELLKQIEK